MAFDEELKQALDSVLLSWPNVSSRKMFGQVGYMVEGQMFAALSDGVVAALQAEGVSVSRAKWLLPAHAVFQAKDAYGGGYPWSAEHTRPDISYELNQYPVAQDCVDTCLWKVYNHRPPNGPEQIKALAEAVRKVYEHLDEVPVGAGGWC